MFVSLVVNGAHSAAQHITAMSTIMIPLRVILALFANLLGTTIFLATVTTSNHWTTVLFLYICL